METTLIYLLFAAAAVALARFMCITQLMTWRLAAAASSGKCAAAPGPVTETIRSDAVVNSLIVLIRNYLSSRFAESCADSIRSRADCCGGSKLCEGLIAVLEDKSAYTLDKKVAAHEYLRRVMHVCETPHASMAPLEAELLMVIVERFAAEAYGEKQFGLLS